MTRHVHQRVKTGGFFIINTSNTLAIDRKLKYSTSASTLWGFATVAQLGFNEVDYTSPSLTSGTYGTSFNYPDTSALNLTRVRLGLPALAASPIPMLRIDSKTQTFLDRNALWPALDVAEKIRAELEKKATLCMDVFVETDSEAQDREELIISYSLKGVPYKEILRIWDDASQMLYKSLPSTMAERTYVRLSKA